MNRARAKRIAWSVLIVMAAAALIDFYLGYPMAFRAGNLKEALGQGPAGPPLRLVARLIEPEPSKESRPNLDRAAAALESEDCLATGTPYPDSATLGEHELYMTHRQVILAPTPSETAYRIEVPPGARLTFGYGVKRFVKDRLQPGARFIVEWREQGKSTRLFEQAVSHPPAGFWEKNRDRLRIKFSYLSPRFKLWDDNFVDAEVDLSALAGRSGELVLVTEPLDNAAAPDQYSPAMWACPEVWAVSGKEPPMNVLLFMVEATPTTAVQPYVNDPAVTPEIREFARGSAVFDKFFTAGDSTNLSVISFFTGRHHQGMDLPDKMYYLAPVVKSRFYGHRYASLAEVFSRAGYETAHFGTNHYIIPTRDFGLDLGFNRIDAANRRFYESTDTMLAATTWLRENAGKPFFLYVHYDAPHDEEKPCIEDLAAAILARTPDPRWRYVRYVAQVIAADRAFGNMLRALETLGIRERTVVILTTDHGNCLDPAHVFAVLREDRRPWWTPFQHGRAMRVEDIRIPFIIDPTPGVEDGFTVPEPASAIDLFPTLVDMLLPQVPNDLARRMGDIDGKSLAPLILRKKESVPPGPRGIYVLSAGGDHLVADGRYHYFYRRQGFEKILYPDTDRMKVIKEGLFDFVADPRELNDLTASNPELAARMRSELERVRPRGSLLSFIYFNFPGGRVAAELDLGGEPGLVMTYPQERDPIDLVPAGVQGIYRFEADLAGPTGLIVDRDIRCVRARLDSRPLEANEFRVGPLALPLLQSRCCRMGDDDGAAGLGESCISRDDLISFHHPMRLNDAPGVYLYRMEFAAFVEETFSDKSLSPAVRSVLKQWGYIE